MVDSKTDRLEWVDEERRERLSKPCPKTALTGDLKLGLREYAWSTGEGLLANGKSGPFLSPLPETGVGTRFGSRRTD